MTMTNARISISLDAYWAGTRRKIKHVSFLVEHLKNPSNSTTTSTELVRLKISFPAGAFIKSEMISFTPQ